MGLNVQASATKQAIDSVTNIVNETTNSIQQTATNDCSAIQIASIIIGGKEFCGAATTVTDGNIELNQNNQVNCALKSSVYSNISTETLNDLKSKLEEEAKKSLESEQGWLAVASSFQLSKTELETTIINNIRNIDQTTINQTCNETARVYNEGRIIICADLQNTNVVINQNGALTSVNQCINTAILKAIFNNSTLQDIAQKTDEKFKSEEEGIGSLLGPFKWLIIGIVVIAALIIIGIILYLLFGGSKTAVKPEQLASLIKPEVRACAARAKAKLAEEGRSGDRNAERFMVERCLSEKRAQERFRSEPESFSRREMSEGEGGEGPGFSDRMRGYARRARDWYGRDGE